MLSFPNVDAHKIEMKRARKKKKRRETRDTRFARPLKRYSFYARRTLDEKKKKSVSDLARAVRLVKQTKISMTFLPRLCRPNVFLHGIIATKLSCIVFYITLLGCLHFTPVAHSKFYTRRREKLKNVEFAVHSRIVLSRKIHVARFLPGEEDFFTS